MAKTENVEKLVFSDDSKETYFLYWHRKWMHNFIKLHIFFKDANDFPGAGSLCDVLDWYEKAEHKASDSWKLWRRIAFLPL